MDAYYRVALIILVSIVAIGLVAIPFGNPKFIDRAIILELSFVTLSVLVWKGYSKALYPCIPLSLLVIVGNSLAPPHVHLMMTFFQTSKCNCADCRWICIANSFNIH